MAFNEEALGPPRCVYCTEVWSMCNCEYPSQDYEELVRKLLRKIDELSSRTEAPHEGRYKDWCLRLNCARIGMDNAAICKVLDEIDGYFHSQQGGH